MFTSSFTLRTSTVTMEWKYQKHGCQASRNTTTGREAVRQWNAEEEHAHMTGCSKLPNHGEAWYFEWSDAESVDLIAWLRQYAIKNVAISIGSDHTVRQTMTLWNFKEVKITLWLKYPSGPNQWESDSKMYSVITRIEIYPVDSVIQTLNNWGLCSGNDFFLS